MRRDLVALAQNGKVQALPVESLTVERATEALEALDAGRVTGRIVLRSATRFSVTIDNQ